MCDKDDGWQKPSLLECASNSFLALQGRVSVCISTSGCNFFGFSFMRACFYLPLSLLRRKRRQQQPLNELSIYLTLEICQRFKAPKLQTYDVARQKSVLCRDWLLFACGNLSPSNNQSEHFTDL